MGHYFKRN